MTRSTSIRRARRSCFAGPPEDGGIVTQHDDALPPSVVSAAWEARPLLEQPTREFSPGLVRQRIPAAETGIDLEEASSPFGIDDQLEAKWSADDVLIVAHKG